jgi:hypothetical protein
MSRIYQPNKKSSPAPVNSSVNSSVSNTNATNNDAAELMRSNKVASNVKLFTNNLNNSGSANSSRSSSPKVVSSTYLLSSKAAALSSNQQNGKLNYIIVFLFLIYFKTKISRSQNVLRQFRIFVFVSFLNLIKLVFYYYFKRTFYFSHLYL